MCLVPGGHVLVVLSDFRIQRSLRAALFLCVILLRKKKRNIDKKSFPTGIHEFASSLAWFKCNKKYTLRMRCSSSLFLATTSLTLLSMASTRSCNCRIRSSWSAVALLIASVISFCTDSISTLLCCKFRLGQEDRWVCVCYSLLRKNFGNVITYLSNVVQLILQLANGVI